MNWKTNSTEHQIAVVTMAEKGSFISTSITDMT
eukprot:CAMPEP_0202942214 /NCGR_PEP_ID=MMETSP1395-20130829/2376_1 /ASSEMBLY_ACC=CAM_ASM_000871 /TAXON_ID=5961 /ORGANISM="Blepharisma japonicum, Strain Stock R1072" /LENGTH=32 /DNA_ID= /DNA_START= /DNA_END= /DNA_ORIENTATION=